MPLIHMWCIQNSGWHIGVFQFLKEGWPDAVFLLLQGWLLKYTTVPNMTGVQFLTRLSLHVSALQWVWMWPRSDKHKLQNPHAQRWSCSRWCWHAHNPKHLGVLGVCSTCPQLEQGRDTPRNALIPGPGVWFSLTLPFLPHPGKRPLHHLSAQAPPFPPASTSRSLGVFSILLPECS